MNEWEAKYRFLVMGITDQEVIDNAERACRACMAMAQSTPYTFEQCVYTFIDLMGAEIARDAVKETSQCHL